MVGLQKHRVQIQQMVDGILIKMAEVRRYRNGLVSRLDPVCHRVCGIVVDVKWLDCQIPQGELRVRKDRVKKLFRILSKALDIFDLI